MFIDHSHLLPGILVTNATKTIHRSTQHPIHNKKNSYLSQADPALCELNLDTFCGNKSIRPSSLPRNRKKKGCNRKRREFDDISRNALNISMTNWDISQIFLLIPTNSHTNANLISHQNSLKLLGSSKRVGWWLMLSQVVIITSPAEFMMETSSIFSCSFATLSVR